MQFWPSFLREIPPGNLFRDWCELWSGGEAPPLFVFLTALAAVGAGIGRKIWLERATLYLPPLFPNPWVLLLAPSGQGKKSTAIRLGVMLLQKAGVEVETFSGKLTPEALVSTLAAESTSLAPGPRVSVDTGRDAVGLIVAREFDVLISQKQQYTSGLVPLLTDLYDCPDEFVATTIGRGRERLRNVCLSVIGAGVPLTIQAQLPPEAMKGGFLPRFILGFFDPRWVRRVGRPPRPDEGKLMSVAERVKEICQERFELRFSPQAEEAFIQWYEAVEVPRSEVDAAYLQRVPEHLLRLMILLHLGQPGPLKEMVELGTFELARRVMEGLWGMIQPQLKVFGAHPQMRGLYYALTLLELNKSLRKSEMLELLAPFISGPAMLDKIFTLLSGHPKVTMERAGKDLIFNWR